MKKLAILRHAKSSWALPGQSDESRQLNDRGHEQLRILAEWIKRSGFSSDAIICSSSVRTRETLSGLSDVIDANEARFEGSLYLGSLDDYLDAIWAAQDCNTLLLIGHNPTCDDLVRYLSNSSSPANQILLQNHFSTGTMAIVEFDVSRWNEVSRAKGQLTHFLRPKLIQEGVY